jgi:hypothetical protein
MYKMNTDAMYELEMHGAVFRGNLNPGNGALYLTEGSGCTGNSHLLRFMGEESGHTSHGHGGDMVLETGMYILCESGGGCSSEEESKEGAGSILWTGDMVLDGGCWYGVKVGKGSAVRGVEML